MITIEQLYGRWINHPDATDECKAASTEFLTSVTALEAEMIAAGVSFPDNPVTECGISGNEYGGFRPQDCPQGALLSSHKLGRAVDRYDPKGEIDAWLEANIDALERHNIYIEAPSSTPHWSHWSDKAPASGHHIFLP